MNDPIGQAIHDFHFLGDAGIVVVDSNYTEGEEIDPAYFFRTLEQMTSIEVTALSLCRGEILDVGAGAGCHSLELQKRGFHPVALEKSGLAAEVLRLRGVRQVICQDIFHLPEGLYDTILLLMNGAGIAGTLEGLGQLLTRLKSFLSPGGRILLDSADISYLFMEEDGSVWMDLSSEKYFGEMIYEVSYRDIKSDKFFWLFVDFETLAEIAMQAGYSCTLVVEGEEGSFLAQLGIK